MSWRRQLGLGCLLLFSATASAAPPKSAPKSAPSPSPTPASASPAAPAAPLPVPIFWQPRPLAPAAAPAERSAQDSPAQAPAAPPRAEAPQSSADYQRVEQQLTALPRPEQPAAPARDARLDAGRPAQPRGSSLQQKYAGVSVAFGVGYGTVLDASGMEGLSYGITGALPLSRWVAIPIYLVLGEGDTDKFGGYQSGLRIGRSFFVDLLVGWVRTKTGTRSDDTPLIEPTTGAGASIGYHVGLFGKDVNWGLVPQVYAGYPFSGESVVIQGLVGLGFRITEP